MSQIEELKQSHTMEYESDDRALEALIQAEKAPVDDSGDIESSLPEKGVALGLHRLLARAYETEGRSEDAHHVLIQIVERLNQEGYWKAMVHVLEPMLDRDAHRAAPLLLRARLQGGEDTVSEDLLLRAHRKLPKHGHLAWEAAKILEAKGDSAAAVQASLQALPALLEDKDYGLLDEVVLALMEAPDAKVTRSLVTLLDKLAHQNDWDRFDAMLEILKERMATPEGAEAAWPKLRAWWLKHPRPESLRPTVVEVLEPTLTAFPSPQAIIRTARINVPSEDPSACLERLDRACRFPPGHYAEHSGWGLGLIRDNDIESVVIDFPTKPVHRMSMNTAERALDPLAPDDLRVWQEKNSEDLARLAKEDAVGLVVMALKKGKDQTATGDEIRKQLVPNPLATAGWSAWWKSTKKKMESDNRVDSRRAFENVFRLADGSEAVDDVSLPGWKVRQKPIKNLAVLDTFLEQHQEARDAVIQEYAERVERVVSNPKTKPEEKAAAALWLTRLDIDGAPPPAGFVGEDFDFNMLPRDYQEELAEGVETTEAMCAALNSRLQSVRQRVWERAEESERNRKLWTAVLKNAADYPEATLFLLKSPVLEPGEETSVLVIKALIELLEDPPKSTHRKRGMALLDVKGSLARTLKAHPVTEDSMAGITGRLKNWSSSDKFRFPLLDFLKQIDHEHINDVVMGHRARAQAKLAERTEGPVDPYDGDVVLSRHSLNRLEAERSRIGMELKTTIPQTIASARELGDLKENAEYHAAKEKQANYASRFQELDAQLNRVRLLEDLERPKGVALPGTEVHLEPAEGSGEPVAYWLLGEGDQDLGDSVVSYRAAMGQALHGRAEGETVSLPGVHEGRVYRITSVREKLPESE